MDLIAHTIDVLFLLLALVFVPNSPSARQRPHQQPPPQHQASLPNTPHTPSAASAPHTPNPAYPTSPSASPYPGPSAASHLSVPRIDTGTRAGGGAEGRVPSITLTPDGALGPSASAPSSEKETKSGPFGLSRRFSARPRSRSRGPSHRTKSVSFSLSSMDDLLPPSPSAQHHLGEGTSLQVQVNKKRPPTPFVRGPKSPSELLVSCSPSASASVSPSPSGSPASSPVVSPGASLLLGGLPGRAKADEKNKDGQGLETETAAPQPPPLTPLPLSHAVHVQDPMGVKKQWLMA